MNRVLVKAPAKVNIILKVLGRRPNGYHDLQMVMVPLTLADDIELEEMNLGVEFVAVGESDEGMKGEGNLVVKAAKSLAQASGAKKGVKITLKKNIPVAAGLGGGSSDAAAVLRGLNRLWGLNWSNDRLSEVGAKLGADVPFFCHGRPAFVEGIGDKVTPYESFPNLSFLLINPGFAVPTPWVYKEWDFRLTRGPSDARVRPLFAGFSDVAVSLENDLEEVTIPAYPELARIKKMLLDNGAEGALMSGSGPTVFAVFEKVSMRDKVLSLDFDKKWRVFAAESIEKF